MIDLKDSRLPRAEAEVLHIADALKEIADAKTVEELDTLRTVLTKKSDAIKVATQGPWNKKRRLLLTDSAAAPQPKPAQT